MADTPDEKTALHTGDSGLVAYRLMGKGTGS